MQEKNMYNMYSGGYIFDQMDRAALFYIKQEAGLPDDAVIVTQLVNNLRFRRQLCNKYSINVHCFDYCKTELFTILYHCKAEILDNKGMIIAEASFTFTKATNHCEIKESK